MAETQQPSPPQSWSDIPPELAGLVLLRLFAHVDRVRFAAVCPQWRAAAREVRLPPPLPLLALPDGTVYSFPGSEPLHFPGCVGYADACGNWLAFSGEDGCFLRDPFSDATMALPQLFRVQVQDPYRRRRAGDDTGISWEEMEDSPEQLTLFKLVFCSPQLIATFVRFHMSTRVAVCQPGAASWWSVHMDRQFSLSADMAFHQGRLYVLNDFRDTLFTVDISVDHRTGDPWVSQVGRVIIRDPSPVTMAMGKNMLMKTLYLAEFESQGALLMVRKRTYGRVLPRRTWLGPGPFIPSGRIEFKVFRADFQQSKYIKVTTIGNDHVLFLRRRCSRVVRVSQEVMLGDCIVFMAKDDEDHERYEVEGLDSCSAYDMRDGTVRASAPMVSWERGSVSATWLFPRC